MSETVGKKKVLLFLQEKAAYNCNSFVRKAWLNNLNINEQYIRGKQWLDPVLNSEIEEIGAIPFTVNKIPGSINKYQSLFVKSTKRTGFAPTTDVDYDQKVAETLKHWSMNVLTQNHHSYYSQLKCKDMLNGGVGYSSFYYDEGKYYYHYENPREIFPDPDDLSPRMDNQNCIVKSYYVNIYDLKNKYPQHYSYFKTFINEDKTSPEDYDFSFFGHHKSKHRVNSTIDNDVTLGYLNNLDNDISQNTWVKGKSLRVVEVFYKKNVKYYECIGLSKPDKNGVQNEIRFDTFDEKFAQENSYNNQITEKQGTCIYKGVYIKDKLLDHGVIPEQVPNQKYLPILPTVLNRDYMSVPYGVVDNLISIQDMINHLASGIMHYKDKLTVFGNDPIQDNEKTKKTIIQAMVEKHGYAYLPESDKAKIIEGSKNGQLSLSLLQYLDNIWESMTGLHDEFSGMINRETSGQAIDKLTLNTLNSQNSLLLAYDHMLVSEGTLMLDTLKGTENISQLVRFYKMGKNQTEYLDSSISLLNFEVYPEAAPNFSSTVEEEKFMFREISTSPNPQFYLNSEYFLKMIGFSDKTAFELSQEWRRVKIDEMTLQMEAQLQMQQKQMEMQQQQQQIQQPQTKGE
jgi:hypothetical protein